MSESNGRRLIKCVIVGVSILVKDYLISRNYFTPAKIESYLN